MDSFMGRGNHYIQLVMVLCCKLPTIGKELPTFPLRVGGFELQTSDVGGECFSQSFISKFKTVNCSLSQ